jgi:hypothetical protein
MRPLLNGGTLDRSWRTMDALARAQSRGAFIDLATQRWVRISGRRVSLSDHPWLDGPVGDVDQIGMDFFTRFAERRGWQVVETGTRGLLESFRSLQGAACEPARVAPEIARFYERTSEYDFDVWSQWSGLFRPFGRALASIFSKRLQQLNVPLSPLDTKLGMVSRVVRLVDEQGRAAGAAWVREAVATRQTVYAGSYSHCEIPGNMGPCVRVAFPLPNGYALVVMKPESHSDGSFTVRSEGRRFGDPGFYFFVQSQPGHGWARYVSSLKESIHVFEDEHGALRADHDLHIWGARFLRLHYRMRRRAAAV